MFTCLRAALFAVAVGLSWPALAETVTLTFVQTNDIDRMEEEDGRGGFARLAALVKAERAKGGPTFFVHSGDTLSPSLLSGIDKGAHIIDILNHMDVDVMVPGNHEFDFGPDVFRERLAEATFPVVSSNITEADGSAPKNTVDHKIVEVNGIKVGFYGLTTEDTPVVSRPGDIRFAPSVEVGMARAGALREAGADFVVAVVHTPINVDFGLVRAGGAGFQPGESARRGAARVGDVLVKAHAAAQRIVGRARGDKDPRPPPRLHGAGSRQIRQRPAHCVAVHPEPRGQRRFGREAIPRGIGPLRNVVAQGCGDGRPKRITRQVQVLSSKIHNSSLGRSAPAG